MATRPSAFIRITADGTAPDLLAVCSRLINKGEILEQLERAVQKFRTLLTLEDFVGLRGSEWGFDAPTIEMARARSERFDTLVGKRYE